MLVFMMQNTDSRTLLLVLQCSCLVVSLMMALLLGFARIHTRTLVRRYESSRWLLFTAMALYTVHYALQIGFGFRAQGDDVGAVINILFYTPATYMVSYSIVNLVVGSRHRRFYLVAGGVCQLLLVACFVLGLTSYHSLHMPWALHVMGALFTLNTAVMIFFPLREMRRARPQIESETADDLSGFYLYMRTGTLLLLLMAIFVPVTIFSLSILAVIGPIFMLALFFYTVSFVALGFNIASVSDYIESGDSGNTQPALAPANESEGTGEPTTSQPAVEKAHLEQAIAQWRARHGYSVTNLGINSLAEQLGVSKRDLSDYIAKVYGTTFRVWLSNVRIEEVKRMLIEHENYSNESIAQECGFSSRSWMQEKFKAQTGLTPLEWKELHKSA